MRTVTLRSGIEIPVEPGEGFPPAAYLGTLGTNYERPSRIGYTSIPVLEFLNGRPWDRIALNYVHALRPSQVRVSEGAVKCNACLWRVTVFVDPDNAIRHIKQEVEIGLVGARHGEDLSRQEREGRPADRS